MSDDMYMYKYIQEVFLEWFSVDLDNLLNKFSIKSEYSQSRCSFWDFTFVTNKSDTILYILSPLLRNSPVTEASGNSFGINNVNLSIPLSVLSMYKISSLNPKIWYL